MAMQMLTRPTTGGKGACEPQTDDDDDDDDDENDVFSDNGYPSQHGASDSEDDGAFHRKRKGKGNTSNSGSKSPRLGANTCAYDMASAGVHEQLIEKYKMLSQQMGDLRSLVKSQQAGLQALRQSQMGASKTAEPDIVYDWKTRDGRCKIPTHSQIVSLIGALWPMSMQQSDREAIVQIMRLHPEDANQFVHGKLTVMLLDISVPPMVLWQLWAFAVEKLPLEECTVDTSSADLPGFHDYGTALLSCTGEHPVYFGRSKPCFVHHPRPTVSPQLQSGLGLPGSQSTLGSRFDNPARSASTDSVPFASFDRMRMDTPSPHVLVPNLSTPSNAKLCGVRNGFEERFPGVRLGGDQLKAAELYLNELDARKANIDACNSYDRIQLLDGKSLKPRQPGSCYPLWSAPCCKPIGDNSLERTCGKCSKTGFLFACAGCGNSFHFDCCDKERQPLGGLDGQWYCGRDECQVSFLRTACGFQPSIVPKETVFQCSVCLDDLNVDLKVHTDNCSCKNAWTCASCHYERVARMTPGQKTLSCPTCKGETQGVFMPMPNLAPPEFVPYTDMPQGAVPNGDEVDDDDDDDDEEFLQVANSTRGRRGSTLYTTEADRQQALAVQQSALAAVRASLGRGEINSVEAVEQTLLAKDRNVDVAFMMSRQVNDSDAVIRDEASSLAAWAEGRARCLPGGRSLGRAANRQPPEPPSRSSSGSSSTRPISSKAKAASTSAASTSAASTSAASTSAASSSAGKTKMPPGSPSIARRAASAQVANSQAAILNAPARNRIQTAKTAYRNDLFHDSDEDW